jgi:hypothetical protein
MSTDFWWGVMAATGGWMGLAGATIVTFTWLVGRQPEQEQ